MSVYNIGYIRDHGKDNGSYYLGFRGHSKVIRSFAIETAPPNTITIFSMYIVECYNGSIQYLEGWGLCIFRGKHYVQDLGL